MDMKLSPQVKKFILPTDNQENYTHRTHSKEIADNILKKGFRFSNSFQKTTDEIIDDLVYLKYWDTLRKHYGEYIIIISFSKPIMSQLQIKVDSNFERPQVLSKIDAAHMKTDEDIFTLPTQFIKGYIKRGNGEITVNPNFDPNFIPPDIEKNLNSGFRA